MSWLADDEEFRLWAPVIPALDYTLLVAGKAFKDFYRGA
jgi:hypothetical protein